MTLLSQLKNGYIESAGSNANTILPIMILAWLFAWWCAINVHVIVYEYLLIIIIICLLAWFTLKKNNRQLTLIGVIFSLLPYIGTLFSDKPIVTIGATPSQTPNIPPYVSPWEIIFDLDNIIDFQVVSDGTYLLNNENTLTKYGSDFKPQSPQYDSITSFIFHTTGLYLLKNDNIIKNGIQNTSIPSNAFDVQFHATTTNVYISYTHQMKFHIFNITQNSTYLFDRLYFNRVQIIDDTHIYGVYNNNSIVVNTPSPHAIYCKYEYLCTLYKNYPPCCSQSTACAPGFKGIVQTENNQENCVVDQTNLYNQSESLYYYTIKKPSQTSSPNIYEVEFINRILTTNKSNLIDFYVDTTKTPNVLYMLLNNGLYDTSHYMNNMYHEPICCPTCGPCPTLSPLTKNQYPHIKNDNIIKFKIYNENIYGIQIDNNTNNNYGKLVKINIKNVI